MKTTIPVNAIISLSPFQDSDKPNLIRYMNDPVIYANTLTVPKHYTEKEADEWLERVDKAYREFKIHSNWVIRHQTAGLIGGIGNFFKNGIEAHEDEIGYWLAAPFRGQGLMSQVVPVYADWLFQHTSLIRLEACVFPHNPASVRILEKAGFEKEGFLRKKHKKKTAFLDAILMAKIKE